MAVDPSFFNIDEYKGAENLSNHHLDGKLHKEKLFINILSKKINVKNLGENENG